MIPSPMFLHPERLWFLLIVPALALLYVFLIRRQQRHTRQYGIDNLQRVLPKQSAWKRHIAVGAALLSLVSLNLAFAQPKDEVDVPRERATIVLTIDVSRSMEATDVAPNRLVAAKSAAGGFVDMLPPGFNVSLVSFAGTSAIIVPPTTDRGMLKRAIDNLQLAPSTAIGEGIYSSLDALALVPPDPKHPDEPTPGAIVLLSDGYTNIGRPSAQAAKDARKVNAPIYTIAYGTPNGYVVSGGRREVVPVDPRELATVARESGGEAFTAGSDAELRQVYEGIARSVGYEKVDKEVTEQYAGVALALAALASLAVVSLAARWP
ncbi:VWA domain-containing protein [Nigerium massiliense]|uniref:VWA domain-containing protein n=1 Tax=Nigerium massiliense TaxID=1522317 RepID=UPI00058BE3CB|nr:VWA domain-containing protein [Nigerium massiliense]